MKDFKKIQLKIMIITMMIFAVSTLTANTILKEARYSSKKSDIFIYANLISIKKEIKKNKISTADLINLLDSENSKSNYLNKMLPSINEILFVGQSEQITYNTGLIVFIKLKSSKFSLKNSKLFSIDEKYKGKQLFKINESGDSFYALKTGKVIITGYKDSLKEYIKNKKNKSTNRSNSFKHIKRYYKKHTLYYYIPMSPFIKSLMTNAVEKGNNFAYGIDKNIFIETIVKMKSFTASLDTWKNYKLNISLIGRNKKDGKRLTMINHFFIVGSSFAISTLNLVGNIIGGRRNNIDNKHIDLIQEKIANIKTKPIKNGSTMFYRLSKNEKNILVYLLKEEINKNKKRIRIRKERANISLLNNYIKDGNFKKIKILTKKIKDINQTSSEGETVIENIAKFGNIDLLEYFLSNGVNINLIDKGILIVNTIKYNNYDVLKYLIDLKINIKQIDSDNSILEIALQNKQNNILMLLVNSGVDLNQKMKNGKTILHIVVENNNIKLATLILKNEIDINAIDEAGNSSLHYACKLKNIELVKLLIENNADKNIENYNYKTALDIAKEKGFVEIIKLFKIEEDIKQ